MNIYGISGLGADKRVFDKLSLDHSISCIDWIEPLKNELIEAYAKRLSKVIDTSAPFILIGVSFGGIMAIELGKYVTPALTILISSATNKLDLKSFYRLAGKLKLTKVIPHQLYQMPIAVATYLFGTEEKQLLKDILKDTDPKFTKWAITALTTWQNIQSPTNCIKINGNKDRLIPFRKADYSIENGHHFMIVDKADEISNIINQEISKIT